MLGAEITITNKTSIQHSYLLFIHLDCKNDRLTAPPVGHHSPLIVMPSSTPRLLGNFTWNVPLLGMTDSERDTQDHTELYICVFTSHLKITWITDFWLKWHFVPATSNSTSSVTLLARAASRSSWLASSRVPSSVGIPLIERSLSPTCNTPHLEWRNTACIQRRHAHMYNNTRKEKTKNILSLILNEDAHIFI